MSSDELQHDLSLSYINLLEDNQRSNINQSGSIMNIGMVPQYQPQLPIELVQDQADMQYISLRGYTEDMIDQLIKITLIYLVLLVYSGTQIGLALQQLLTHWNVVPVVNLYTISVILQFTIHSYYFQKQIGYTKNLIIQCKETNDCPEQLQLFMTFEVLEHRSVGFFNLWNFIQQKEFSIVIFNKLMYICMYIVGDFVFIWHYKLDNWYIYQLLFPGWMITLLICSFIGIFCLSLPILICHSCIVIRDMRRQTREDEEQNKLQVLKFNTLLETSGQPCYICLSEFEPENLIIQLRCHPNHVYHEECLKPWLEQNNWCPICRQLVRC